MASATMQFRCVRVVVQTEGAAPAGVERLGCLHHGQRQVHAVEHGTARAGIGGEFGVRQEVQGHVELLDRTRAGLLLGVERILDTADEEARLVDPSAQDALRRRAQFVADGLQHVLYRRQDVLLAVAEARQVVDLDLVEAGEDDVQLAGVAGDRDALEGGRPGPPASAGRRCRPATPRRRDLRCPAGCGPRAQRGGRTTGRSREAKIEEAAADQPRPAGAGRVCTGQGACARAPDEVPALVIYWRGRGRRACTPHSSNGASLIAVMSAPYLFTNFARPWGTRTASARNACANAFLNPTRG